MIINQVTRIITYLKRCIDQGRMQRMGTGGSTSLGLPLAPTPIARAATTSYSTTATAVIAAIAVAVLKEK